MITEQRLKEIEDYLKENKHECADIAAALTDAVPELISMLRELDADLQASLHRENVVLGIICTSNNRAEHAEKESVILRSVAETCVSDMTYINQMNADWTDVRPLLIQSIQSAKNTLETL